jgi:hypothetical protein
MTIYVHHDGQQQGPFTEAEIKALLSSGAISLQDPVWWEGQAGWVPLGQTTHAGTGTPVVPATPGVPYPVGAAAPPTSNLAIAALVAGCVSILCSLFASIPAIVLGHMGLSQIKKNPGMQGHGMALAGLILGYVFTAFYTLYLGIVVISVLIALGNQVKEKNLQVHVPAITNTAPQ